MHTKTQITVNSNIEDVWQTITDIEHSSEVISSINSIEILKKGDSDKVGLTWRESRIMMGKEAFETMWISEISPNQYYVVLAESHKTKYRSVVSVTAISNDKTELTMEFTGEPQGAFTKILSTIMMPFFKGSLTKMLHQDLIDIKQYVENK
ncbi:SRPBCC family protein [Psychrosphaera sp. B3R10]|nr:MULTISPECIES: SRPBCC family protein [unclassified Psychrosphaera]MBU2881362.1 SRPBCC family protein [Psychrosphaera sp. I2R16]MBU2988461.1 SRPBCC family protein [Psychrosphaera sp. B3R10]